MKLLDKSERNNPNAIEDNFIAKLKEFNATTLIDEYLSSILIRLLFVPDDKVSEIYKQFTNSVFNCQVIETKLKFHTIKLEDKLKIYLSSLCETPGEIVMYLWWLQWWGFSNNKMTITIQDFNTLIFPMGYFSREDLHIAWNAQKVDRDSITSDNLLDYFDAGKSIM